MIETNYAVLDMKALHWSPLVSAAHANLVRDLKNHGNTLSELHSAALLQLLDTYGEYIDGKAKGRKAFGLPTGMGKTSSVVALILAMHQQDHPGAVAVASSRVEALCDLKNWLIGLGVPEDKIGLKHSKAGAASTMFCPCFGTTTPTRE